MGKRQTIFFQVQWSDFNSALLPKNLVVNIYPFCCYCSRFKRCKQIHKSDKKNINTAPLIFSVHIYLYFSLFVLPPNNWNDVYLCSTTLDTGQREKGHFPKPWTMLWRLGSCEIVNFFRCFLVWQFFRFFLTFIYLVVQEEIQI